RQKDITFQSPNRRIRHLAHFCNFRQRHERILHTERLSRLSNEFPLEPVTLASMPPSIGSPARGGRTNVPPCDGTCAAIFPSFSPPKDGRWMECTGPAERRFSVIWAARGITFPRPRSRTTLVQPRMDANKRELEMIFISGYPRFLPLVPNLKAFERAING